VTCRILTIIISLNLYLQPETGIGLPQIRYKSVVFLSILPVKHRLENNYLIVTALQVDENFYQLTKVDVEYEII